ncbi:MAG: hypothetical protein WBA10_10285 [Elainellaceae cyanobacterium]
MTAEKAMQLIEQAAAEGWTELDLAGLGLTEVPAEVGQLTQLESLILGKWEREKEGTYGIQGLERVEDQWLPIVSGNAIKSLSRSSYLISLSGTTYQCFQRSRTTFNWGYPLIFLLNKLSKSDKAGFERCYFNGASRLADRISQHQRADCNALRAI